MCDHACALECVSVRVTLGSRLDLVVALSGRSPLLVTLISQVNYQEFKAVAPGAKFGINTA